MHVLFFIERVAELLRCAYQAQLVNWIWGDVAERARQSIQQGSSDIDGVGQLLQCAFNAIGKGFRAHMGRPGYALATFRHSLTQAQLQGVMAERTKGTLASMKAVREQGEKAMAEMVQTQRPRVPAVQQGGSQDGPDRRARTLLWVLWCLAERQFPSAFLEKAEELLLMKKGAEWVLIEAVAQGIDYRVQPVRDDPTRLGTPHQRRRVFLFFLRGDLVAK
jgi:hypothetical protein